MSLYHLITLLVLGVALNCYGVASRPVIEDLSSKAAEQGLKLSPAFRKLNEVLAGFEEAEGDEDKPAVLLFEEAKEFFEEKAKDPTYDKEILKSWNQIASINENDCSIDTARRFQINVDEADANWHRIRSRWHTYEPKYTIQKVILLKVYEHALTCEKVYAHQHDELSKDLEGTETMKFTDDFGFYLRNKCSPKSNWLKLRPGLKYNNSYYACVRDTMLTKNLPILRKSLKNASKLLVNKRDQPLDIETQTKLAQDGQRMCRDYVNRFDSIFNLAAWDAGSFKNPIFGPSRFNKSWVILGTCKEFLKKSTDEVVDAFMKEQARRYST